ncbi:hypothetical protein M422DRAFT_247729 [Sphaerobolus stellatus SS14]|nr:hypothetical protein M422DRAFT_247729 [Sphaerobolus stellatus SS14]
MSHCHSGRRMQAEELFAQAVEGDEPIPGLTTGDLMDPPSTSVDPQQSPESPLSMARPSNTAMQGLSPTQLAGASGTANWGLDSPRRVAVASGTATQGSYSPRGMDQGSGSWQNLGDAPSEPDHVSPDGGDTEEYRIHQSQR